MIDRQYSSYCFLVSELSIEKKIKYYRQAAYSQSMGFAINISHAHTWQNAFFQGTGWIVPFDLREWNWPEIKSLIWAEKGKLYIIYEKVMWILGILRFKSIHLLFYTFIHMYISNDSNVILKYFHFVFKSTHVEFKTLSTVETLTPKHK
jgi:hypothetical protein